MPSLFALSKIADLLLRPSLLVLILCFAGLACHAFRRAAAGRRWTALGAVLLVLASLPPGDWPLAALENRFPAPTALPAQVDGIIVLGGAIDLAVSTDRQQPGFRAGAERLTTFVTLARRFPEAKLIFTGGSSDIAPDSVREADVARALFAGLGVDTDRVLFERNSRNTRENAVLSMALAQPKAGETWLLIAAAADMPRAVGCFRAVGWPVVPWPTGYRTRQTGFVLFTTPAVALANLDWAAHEWIGLGYYRLRGWIDAWFPGPVRPGP